MQTNALVEMVERASLWRSDPASWTESDPDLALAAGTGVQYRPRALQALPAPGVHIMTGPRRAGKTVASLLRVQELLDIEAFRPEAVVRASLDTFDKDDLRTLLTSQQVADQLGLPQEGPRLWVLDEVTSVDGWVGAVKHAVERNGPLARDAVVLTGSRAPDIGPTALTVDGPRTWERLLPMSFRDVCHARDLHVPTAVPASELFDAAGCLTELHQTCGEALREAFDQYLVHGGYPLTVGMFLGSISDDGVQARAAALPDALLQGAAHDAGIDPAEARRALCEILERSCSPTRLAELGRVLGGNRELADGIVKSLELAHVTWRIYNADGSDRSRDYVDPSRPKLYLMDPMLAAAADADPAPYREAVFETMVGVHLGRAVCRQETPFWEGLRYDLASDGEVDYLPVDPATPAVEVKSGGTGDAAAVIAARHGRGIVATRDRLDLTGPVWHVPAAYLCAVLALSS